MAEIMHKIGVNVSPEKVYQALTTDAGLEKWWTTDTKGAGPVGSVIKFRFNGGGPDFKVTELEPNATVKWKCIGGGSETWHGTEVAFSIQKDEKQTRILFAHRNWPDAPDFMAHCNTKWAIFLMSLKEYLETGKGRPFPDDVHINHT